ncbi:MAG: hypothetical protein R6X16_08520 [Anaerolineae bacterium]
MERLQRLWVEYRATLIFVAVLAVAWLFLKSPATAVASAEEVTGQIGQGQPVVLYFFSNT